MCRAMCHQPEAVCNVLRVLNPTLVRVPDEIKLNKRFIMLCFNSSISMIRSHYSFRIVYLGIDTIAYQFYACHRMFGRLLSRVSCVHNVQLFAVGKYAPWQNAKLPASKASSPSECPHSATVEAPRVASRYVRFHNAQNWQRSNKKLHSRFQFNQIYGYTLFCPRFRWRLSPATANKLSGRRRVGNTLSVIANERDERFSLRAKSVLLPLALHPRIETTIGVI